MLEERVARMESDVEHIKNDIGQLRTELGQLRTEVHVFQIDVTRELGSLRTLVEQGKLWMVVTGVGMVATWLGAWAALGRLMKWY